MMSERAEQFPLHRRDVAKTLLQARDDMLIVTGLGSTNWDFTAAGDQPRIFPVVGCHGRRGADWLRAGPRTTP